jgi:hypothetical protein
VEATKLSLDLLDSILLPYPSEFKRIRYVDEEDLGENMPYLGKVFRIFNPRSPDYHDDDVREFIEVKGDSLNNYMNYGVVPRKLEHAKKSILRYNRTEDPFSERVKCFYDEAGVWLEKEFGHWVSGSRVLSYDEIIEWLRPLKSPGYPWTLVYPYKCDYWASPDADFYSKYWCKLSTPDYIRSLCSVSIKEEVRPADKIENGDVRTIISMDVNHVVAHCQLTLQQNQRLIASNTLHSSALGLNLLQGGFHKLNAKMSKFGDKSTLELDGKKFDARFRKYCFDKIRDFRFSMLNKEEQTSDNYERLKNLYYELTYAPLVNVDGSVYGRCSGNPSGQACTTPDNTLKNFMDIVVLWHLIMPKEYHTYDSFKEHLILCICGDDINISVHPDVQNLFNSESIRLNMSQIDMEYHFASMQFRDNSECTFLGHGYKLCDVPSCGYAMYMPVIDCEKMRTNMLIYNEQKTAANCIVRACGLRNETFACDDCRKWFSELIEYLRNKYAMSQDPQIQEAWKSYLTDRELWRVYAGLESINCSAVSQLKPLSS